MHAKYHGQLKELLKWLHNTRIVKESILSLGMCLWTQLLSLSALEDLIDRNYQMFAKFIIQILW